MQLRDKLRLSLGIVVLGSLICLVIYANLTELDHGAQAALYALIAATGLAVVRGNRTNETWATLLIAIVGLCTLGAGVLSAYMWLLNEKVGTVIELAGGLGAMIAIFAFLLNIDGDGATTSIMNRTPTSTDTSTMYAHDVADPCGDGAA